MKNPWTQLAKHLEKRSKEICALNKCTGEDHHCESYAYIRKDGGLMDICASDFFQGCSAPHAAIPLPWKGCGRDLKKAVEEDC